MVNNGILFFCVRAINGRGYQVLRVAGLKPDMVSLVDRRRHLIDSLFVSSTRGWEGGKNATCTCGISLAFGLVEPLDSPLWFSNCKRTTSRGWKLFQSSLARGYSATSCCRAASTAKFGSQIINLISIRIHFLLSAHLHRIDYWCDIM